MREYTPEWSQLVRDFRVEELPEDTRIVAHKLPTWGWDADHPKFIGASSDSAQRHWEYRWESTQGSYVWRSWTGRASYSDPTRYRVISRIEASLICEEFQEELAVGEGL